MAYGVKYRLEFDDDRYFPGEDIRGIADNSLDLLVVMVGIAALTRWL